jgi:outer membrane protein assembly factor BamA
VNRSVRAALVRFAALGGLLIVPAAASAQLKCLTPSDREIRRVAFSGNTRFSDDELRRHVLSEPTDKTRKFFKKLFGTQRCLRPGLLASDSARLKAFYSDQGFPSAMVRNTARLIGDHWVDIDFTIVEGAPVTIDSVSVTGLAGLGLGDDLPRLLHSKVGARYSPALVQSDVDSIETRLRNSGYPQGIALADQGVIKGTTKARVALNVVPGPKTRIGSITIVDTAITGKGAVINEKSIRQLLTFKEGDLYS